MRGREALSSPRAAWPVHAFTWTVITFRVLVVAGWIAGAVLATLWLPQLQQSHGGALSDLVAKDAQALKTEARSTSLFGAPITPDTMVVQRDPRGLTQDEQKHAVARALKIDNRGYPDLLSISFAVPILNADGLVPASRERSTTAVTYLYFPPRYGFETRDTLAHTFTERHIPTSEGLVGVTGAGPARIAQYHAIRDALPIVGAATAALIALLVGLNFLSPGPALLVLCAGGLSYLVDIRLLGWVSERSGISIPSEIEPLLVVLLLGISTDYAIFYLSGQRRRLREGEEPLPEPAAWELRRARDSVFSLGHDPVVNECGANVVEQSNCRIAVSCRVPAARRGADSASGSSTTRDKLSLSDSSVGSEGAINPESRVDR